MKKNRPFGIIKFFKNEKHLDELCGGKLYCNTPEFYRLHDEKGVSDRAESCTWSFRKSRGDTGAKIVIGGHTIENSTNVTIRGTGEKDSWLHCWTKLEVPDNEEELGNFIRDINRIRSEFGLYYAYIEPSKIKPFIDHLKTLTTHEIISSEVVYNDISTYWSPKCKSLDYQYQREFRILIGECKELSTKPLIRECKQGFNEYIEKNVKLEIISNDGKWIWFGLHGPKDLISNKPKYEITDAKAQN